MDIFIHKALLRHVPKNSSLTPIASNPETPSSESEKEQAEDQNMVQLEDLVKLRKKVKRRMSQRVEPMQEIEIKHLKSPKAYVVSAPETTTNLIQRKDQATNKMIRMTHSFRIKWDLFVMCLAIWNVFCIPYTLVFNPSFGDSVAVVVINLSIDFMFFVDILLTFRTTYYSSTTGDEVKKPGLVAKNYLLGKFWIDLLTCIPDDFVGLLYPNTSTDVQTQNIIALIGILKLYRISRLNRIINFMRAKSDVKLVTRILQLMLFLIMYVHLLACAWWILTRYDETWVPLGGGYELYEDGTTLQYWSLFYAAVHMLVGGEMVPNTSLQAGFAGIMLFFGAFIKAVMFGSMAVLMSNLNMRQTKFQETQNVVNTAMKNMRLPELLQQRISDYMIYTQATMASSEEFDTFRSLISPSLYNEVLQCIYGLLIKDNEIVASSEAVRNFILPKLKPQFCKPEEVLVQQGEEGTALYFVARGTCQVMVADELRNEKLGALLKPGSHFGEVALLTNGQRTATVRALNYSTLAVLDKEDFLQMISLWPNCKNVLKRGMFQYQDKFKRFLLRMLRRVPTFKGLRVKTEQELLYSLRIESIEEGEYLAMPGQGTESMWLLAEGEIEVSVTISDFGLNQKRMEMYQVTATSRYGQKSEWNLKTAVVDSALKEYTEVFPVWGSAGIDRALHSTEVDTVESKKLLGRNCVELELDLLRTGSVFGLFNCLAGETFCIQAKALTKCTCYVLDKSTLSRLRKTCVDLHDNLVNFESWSKVYTPYIDDYQVANDADRSFQLEFNLHRGRYRFRGAVLRIIKDNRDRKVLEMPMLAVMLKGFKRNPVSRKVTAMRQRADSHLTSAVLKATFNPLNREKLLKPKDVIAEQVQYLMHAFNEQKDMISSLKEQIQGLSQTMEQYPAADQDDIGEYRTIAFRPK